MRITQRLAAVLAVGSALALSGLASSPASADPTPSGTAVTGWLHGQLQNGVLGGDCSFYCGPTIDAARAFAVLGDTADLAAVNTAVAADPSAYSDYDYTYMGHFTGRASGAVAKELVLAQLAGANAKGYGPGSVDLVTRLEALVGSNGRLTDDAQKDGAPDPDGDFASSIGQSFAAQGLQAAGSPKAAAVTSYLLAQQCPAGYFRFSFAPKATDTACTANTPDPGADTTAFAVLALQSQLSNVTVKAAVDRAVAWLTTQQAANGSFLNSDGIQNSNSTGLAGWALGSACRTDAATKAAAFVRTLQVPATQTGDLAADKGAIAFTAAQLADSQAAGIDPADRSSFWTASAQAAASLNWDPSAAATVQVTAPKAAVKGGDDAQVTITGASAGERVCVTDSNGAVAALTGTGSPLTYTVDTAKKGGDVSVFATTGPGKAAGTVSVLGKQKLKPKLASTVHQGDRAPVKLKGLGAKEKVKVYVDGKVVAKGKANGKGVFKGHFVANFKLGVHKLKVVGQYKFRVGRDTFRVVG